MIKKSYAMMQKYADIFGVENFYSISSSRGDCRLQGNFNSKIGQVALSNEFHVVPSSLGYSEYEKIDDGIKISIVLT